MYYTSVPMYHFTKLTLATLSFVSGLFCLCSLICPLLQIGCYSKIKNRMANNVDPDEMVHRDLHCLQMYQFWSAGMTGLSGF